MKTKHPSLNDVNAYAVGHLERLLQLLRGQAYVLDMKVHLPTCERPGEAFYIRLGYLRGVVPPPLVVSDPKGSSVRRRR